MKTRENIQSRRKEIRRMRACPYNRQDSSGTALDGSD